MDKASGLGLLAAFTIARRELRGAGGSLVFFIGCLCLGVAAIAAIGLVDRSVQEAVGRDARTLLGGDLALENPSQPLAADDVQALRPPDARLTAGVRVNSTAHAGEQQVPVVIKAVDAAYPLYGSVGLDPPVALPEALADHGAVAEAAFLTRLRIKVGDSFSIGAQRFVLRAVLRQEPDRLGGFISIGPRVILSDADLAATQILQPGAMADFDYRFALAPGSDPAVLGRALQASHPGASWRLRTSADVQPSLARFADQISTYLTLAGITALLIGGIGIGLTVQTYLATKRRSIAILKCIGASGQQVALAYVMQIMVLGLGGVLGGLLLGALLPVFFLQASLHGLLPVSIPYFPYPRPLLMAGAVGLLTTLIFALLPLGRALVTSPAALFRIEGVAGEERIGRLAALLLVLALAVLAGLIALSVARPLIGLGYFAAVLVTAGLLWLGARTALASLRHFAGLGPTTLRLALRTLGQHGGAARSVTVALGAGIAALSAVLLVQSALEADLARAVPKRAPTSVYIDIQPNQLQRFKDIVSKTPGAAIQEAMPQIRARIVSLGGVPVAQAKVADDVKWTLQRDRGVTFSATPPPDTTLVAGSWWAPDYAGPLLLSIGADYARGYNVRIGDTIGLNVLGRVIEAKIANLRKEVDFTSGRLEFLFIMSPGLISSAPHTIVATIDATADADPALMASVTTALPNVTPISVGAIVTQVQDLLAKLGLAVTITAAVTIVSGLIVLASAIGAARRRLHYQTVLLKVLGATRRDALSIITFEYVLQGVAASLVGMVLGSIAAWLIVTRLLKLDWIFAGWPLVVVAGSAVLLTLLVALLATARLLAASPATILRRT